MGMGHEARITVKPFLCKLAKQGMALLMPEGSLFSYSHHCDTCHFLGCIRGGCVHVCPKRDYNHTGGKE